MGADDSIQANLGLTSSATGSLVLWMRRPQFASNYCAFENSLQNWSFSLNAAGIPYAIAADGPDYTNWVDWSSVGPDLPDDEWACYLVSWKTDLAAGAKLLQIYRGDVNAVTSKTDDGGSFLADLSSDPWTLLNAADVDVSWAEVWFDTTFIDFTVEENRLKFMTPDGKPADIGADGSAPTGDQPLIYLSVRAGDSAADFCNNRGTGPNFTQNGSLTLAPSSPSD